MSDSTRLGAPSSHRPPRHLVLAVVAMLALVTVIAAAAGVVTIVAAVGGLYAWNLGSTFDSETEKLSEAFPSDEAARPPAARAEPGQAATAQNILLLGSDKSGPVGGSIDEIRGQRSDTIMVVHVPADRENIYVMSILRDSWLDIPGHGRAKVNAALSWGGVPLAVATIEGLVGARMDHVAVVDFEGFGGVTDAVGGVDVDNPIGFDSTSTPGLHFAAGVHRLDGEEALAFVRERNAFRDGDFQRARNQQAFVQALLGRALSAETLTSPAAVSGMVGAIAPFLAVDEGLDFAYLAGLGVELRKVRADGVTFFTLPTAGTGTAGGQSVVNIDWTEIPALQQAFRGDALDAYQAEVQAAP